MEISERATRASFCQAFSHGEGSAETPRVIDNLLAGLRNLRSLNWCVECRPSGSLSEDWKASRLREELEMSDRACPKIEYLGLLNFLDSWVSDAIVHEMASNGTENFVLDGIILCREFCQSCKKLHFILVKNEIERRYCRLRY